MEVNWSQITTHKSSLFPEFSRTSLFLGRRKKKWWHVWVLGQSSNPSSETKTDLKVKLQHKKCYSTTITQGSTLTHAHVFHYESPSTRHIGAGPYHSLTETTEGSYVILVRSHMSCHEKVSPSFIKEDQSGFIHNRSLSISQDQYDCQNVLKNAGNKTFHHLSTFHVCAPSAWHFTPTTEQTAVKSHLP